MNSAQRPAPDQLDIGVIVQQPLKDPEWLKKCLVMGLLLFVPIVGWFNLSGWIKAIADRNIAGGPDKDLLPDAGLHYAGHGWRMFLSSLPLVGLFVGAWLVVGVVGGVMMASGGEAAQGGAVALFLLAYAGTLLSSLVLQVFSPAMTFLHVVDGEPWASVQFRRIWEVIKEGGVQYLLLFVTMMLAGMVAYLGALVLFVGMFISVPFACAMMGKAFAEYARVLRPTKPGFAVDGGVGSDSGTPFGVKL